MPDANRRAVITGAASIAAGGFAVSSSQAAADLDARQTLAAIDAMAPLLERSGKMVISRALVEQARMALEDDEQFDSDGVRECFRAWKRYVAERLRRALAGEPISRARCVSPDL